MSVSVCLCLAVLKSADRKNNLPAQHSDSDTAPVNECVLRVSDAGLTVCLNSLFCHFARGVLFISTWSVRWLRFETQYFTVIGHIQINVRDG